MSEWSYSEAPLFSAEAREDGAVPPPLVLRLFPTLEQLEWMQNVDLLSEDAVSAQVCVHIFLSASDTDNNHAPRVQRSRSKRLESMEIISKT